MPQGLYQGHDVTLYNYLASLVPKVNEDLQEGMRNAAALRNYEWMYRLVSWKDAGGDWRPRWIDSGLMRPLPKVIETAAYPNTEVPSAVNAYLEMEKYGEQLPVTEEYLLGAAGKLQLERDLGHWVREFSQAALYTQRNLISDIFLDAFTGTVHQTWESKALCDEDHSFQVGGQNYSNVKHSPLSADAIEEIEQDMGLWIDSNDHGHIIDFDTLVVSKKNYNEAIRISKTLARVGTELNDVNVMYGKYNIIVLPDLHETSANTASDWWFLLDSNIHTLVMYMFMDPQIKLVGNLQNDDIAYRQKMICQAGWYGPVGIVGSDGQGS